MEEKIVDRSGGFRSAGQRRHRGDVPRRVADALSARYAGAAASVGWSDAASRVQAPARVATIRLPWSVGRAQRPCATAPSAPRPALRFVL